MPSLALLQRHLWVSSRKLAEKHLGRARQLMNSQDPADIHTALGLLDATLKLFPQSEKALELKARALLCLRRFKDIANLLQESIPSLKANGISPQNAAEEKLTLLPTRLPARRVRKISLAQCFSLFPLWRRVLVRCSVKGDKEQWKYTVLGQACCHLGMMEDAMILLSNGKRAASAAYRKQSSHFNEDSFFLDGAHIATDAELITHLLGNIKLLLRRRTAGLAALDAGLYTEAARHFSKIVDGRRGTPQGFVAECYMHRAMAYQAANRIVDAIADCNRSIALNPLCAEALSTRANLYETIGCLSDSLRDLEKLKALYETIFRNNVSLADDGGQSSASSDLQGCIDFINIRVDSISERMAGHSAMDQFRVLGVPRGCSRPEVERAYLILSLKHRPDKAAQFVDRCEFVDERDIESVKDEARSLGVKLFKLLQKAYTWVMALVLQEEMSRVREIQDDSMTSAEYLTDGCPFPLSSCNSMYASQNAAYNPRFFSIGGEAQSFLVEEENGGEVWLTQQEGLEMEDQQTTAFHHDMLERSHKDLEDLTDLDSFDGVGHLVDAAALFGQVSTCRESASMGTTFVQGLSASEAWMGSNDWNHQGHSTHALPVT